MLGPRTNGLYAVAEYAEPLPRGRKPGLFLQAGSIPQSVNLIPYYLGGRLPGQGVVTRARSRCIQYGDDAGLVAQLAVSGRDSL